MAFTFNNAFDFDTMLNKNDILIGFQCAWSFELLVLSRKSPSLIHLEGWIEFNCTSICHTWASFSGSPAFFKKPCSSALIPFPVSYDHLYEPSTLISCSWLIMGIGVVDGPLGSPCGAERAQPNRAVSTICWYNGKIN